MKVYIPVVAVALRELESSRSIGPAPVTAFAVTPALRDWYAADDGPSGDAAAPASGSSTGPAEEELDYQALTAAARSCLRLLSADPSQPRRRIVVVADAPLVTPRPELDLAVVRVGGVVPISAVLAVYADAAEAEPDVGAAADAIVEADLGGEDAQFTVDSAEGHDLAWYATQEIGALVELL